MRCIKAIVNSFPELAGWDLFDVRGKAELPGLDYDIYISTGGPGSPHDGDGEWDRRYYEWLESIWEWNRFSGQPKKHVFFICHSFQMACKFFRIGQVTARKSTSFGTFLCHMTDAGTGDPLLQELPNPFYVADFRDWQVVQPDVERINEIGASILALEKIRPRVPLERAIMAMRFSGEIVGTQFHPEADPDGMIIHFLDPERRRKITDEHSERKYMRMMNHLGDPDKISLTYELVLPGFLYRSIRKTQQAAIPI